MAETQDWFAQNAPSVNTKPSPGPYGDVYRDRANLPPVDAALLSRQPTREPSMHAPAANEPVTVADLKADPLGSMTRIGSMLKKDLTDPKLWLSAAAMYFGPKVFNVAAPIIARAVQGAPAAAVRGVSSMADMVSPDAVGIVSPRLGKVFEVAQKLRAAQPAPTAPVTSPAEMPAAGGTPLPRGLPPPEAPPSPRPSGVVIRPPATPGATASLLPDGANVPPATPEYYPQKFLNETAIQARRQGVTLGDADYALAKGMVEQGHSPQEAVQAIVQARTAPPPAAPAAAASAPATPPPFRLPQKLKLSSDESTLYAALRKQGKSDQQILQAIEAQRALAAQLGGPSSQAVRAAVKDRNATGQWSPEQP